MSVDLRLENFARDFYAWILEFFLPDLPRFPTSNYKGDESETDWTLEIEKLIFLRLCIFNIKLTTDLNEDYMLYSNNGVDCYHYICSHVTSYFAYPELNIFNEMLMSLAVVIKMILFWNHRKNILEKLTVVFSWAMYFETRKKEEFYAAGGAFKHFSKASALDTFGGEIVTLVGLKHTDLEAVEKIYKNSEEIYNLDDVIEIFKTRAFGQNGSPSCSNCLPMFDVFYSISYGRDTKIHDLQLVEGYLQLFSRMLIFNEKNEIYNNMWESNLDYNIGENVNIFNNKCKVAATKVLQNHLFVGKDLDNLESSSKSKCCIFCGEDTKRSIKAFKYKDDFERIQDVKRYIYDTVSNVETAETAYYTQKIKVKTCKVLTDEVEEKIVLRMFSGLGMETSLSKIKTNVEREFSFQFQNRSPKVILSTNYPKVQEKEIWCEFNSDCNFFHFIQI